MYRIAWVLLFMLGNCYSATLLTGAEGQERGIVRMHGSILETPCAIDMADTSQTIELGVETTGELEHDGHGPNRPFSIHLINCNLATGHTDHPEASWFQMTFDGDHDGSLYGLYGASGVGLQIYDINGNISRPGEPMQENRLLTSHMTLNYMLRLAKDHHRLCAGDYRTAIRFKIDYF